MKFKDDEEICDVCKERLAKKKCIGCGIALCPGCMFLLTMKIDIAAPNEEEEVYSAVYGEKAMGILEWAICKDCKKEANKHAILKEIEDSPETVALINKIRKTILASKILNGLEDSEIKRETVTTPFKLKPIPINPYPPGHFWKETPYKEWNYEITRKTNKRRPYSSILSKMYNKRLRSNKR